MGIAMKKLGLTIAAALAFSGSALAADMPARMYTKAVAPVIVSPWDFAFGAALTNDYRFRGIAQSNRLPSVSAYFEPRYNVNPNLQLYAGVGGASISFPNRAAAEIDVYGGIRPTFGAFAFDFGVFGYIYPGGTCHYGVPGFGTECTNNFLTNGNVIKKNLSFYEGYAKVLWTVNDMWALGANAFYSPSFLNSGANGAYVSGTVKFTAPSTWFGASGLGMYISGEGGYQWLGTSDPFYGTGFASPLGGGPFPNGINYADYATWNIGVGFTYKVFTLDFRYSDTNLSKANCNAFTSDHTAVFNNSFSPINPTGVGSKWCGAAGIVKFSADLTAMSNLK
jgi:uncharacterized protein (TIGR02001 family)